MGSKKVLMVVNYINIKCTFSKIFISIIYATKIMFVVILRF